MLLTEIKFFITGLMMMLNEDAIKISTQWKTHEKPHTAHRPQITHDLHDFFNCVNLCFLFFLRHNVLKFSRGIFLGQNSMNLLESG